MNFRVYLVFIFLIYGCMTARSIEGVFIGLPSTLICVFAMNKITTDSFVPKDLFWFCCLLFFGISPMQYYSEGVFWGWNSMPAPIRSTDAVLASMFSAMSLGIIAIVGTIIDRNPLPEGHIKNPGGTIKLLIFLFLLCWIGYYSSSGGFHHIWMSRLEKVANEDTGTLVRALFQGGMIASLVRLTRIILQSRSKMSWKIWFAACITLMVLLFNPLNTSRFVLIGSYLPMILMYSFQRVKAWVVYSFICIGVFVLMPIMSVSTRFGNLEGVFESEYFRSTLLIPDMDVLQMFAFSIEHVRVNGFTNGDMLAAVIFAFIPRSIWQAKPVVSGILIGTPKVNQGLVGTDNLSSPIFSDLYMDFGLSGIIVGAFAIGAVVQYFFTEKSPYKDHVWVMCGFTPILLRGPVGAVISLPLIAICATYLVEKYVRSERIS